MQLPLHAIIIAAVLALVVLAAGYAGILLSMDSPLVHTIGGERILGIHQLIPKEGKSIVLDEDDNNEAFEIPRNTQFTIILRETLAQGYSWNTSMSSELALLNSQYVADPDAPRFDVNGTHLWILRPEGPGMQEFNASFVRKGFRSDTDRHSYLVRLLVR